MRKLLPLVLFGIAACARPTPGSSSRAADARQPPPPAADTPQLPPLAVREPTGPARVTIERTSASSFHAGYFEIFKAHQPVYVTADAILHALHESYDAILIELETASLAPAVDKVLANMRSRLSATPPETRGRADVDAFLTVAASLSTGKPLAPVAGADAAAIAQIVDAAEAAGGPGPLVLFGKRATFDYSMMKPRGHYTKTPALQRYFRVMSFLGRAELRVAEREGGTRWALDRRVLEGAALLRSLLSPEDEKVLRGIDMTLGMLVGPADSLSLVEADPAALRASDHEVIAALEPLTRQKIGTQLAHAGHDSISLLVLGQRYVFDSHVFSAVTYGQLSTKRMMPSTLDVATVVFGNPSAKAMLAPQIAAYGAEYANALVKMGKAREDAGDSLWKGSIHHLWLGALRELSPDGARDKDLPDPFLSES